MKTRTAKVEGRFYPSGKQRIFEQIRKMESAGRYPVRKKETLNLIGAILPHAGHLYSGYQTIPFFQMIKRVEYYPETVVIVHPNHTGYGRPVAIEDADVWSNTAGEVALDREMAIASGLPMDSMDHTNEHSAEVLVPYFQYYFPRDSFSILPVCMLDQSHDNAVLVAHRIRHAVIETGRRILVIASSDFSHFLSPQEGKATDQHVIDHILSRNAAGVEMAVKKHHISVCGYGPIMTLMEYAAAIFPDYSVEILARGHSGEVVPSREVVDYISMIMYQ